MFKANKKGFTLIETVVAIFIFVLALGSVVGFIVAAYRTQSYTWEQSIAIDEARRGIETMVKEIREAQTADDGSFPIEKADDKEFIFYSDIDKDGQAERVRYFLGTVSSGTQTKDCVTFLDGGSCSVSFSNFLSGTLETATLKISVEGDFGRSNEYAKIYADGDYLGKVCETGCRDCPASWEGTKTFNVFSQAQDNSIQFIADASARVNNICDWEEPNHSMKAKFEFSWTETLPGAEHEFKKGVIEPTGSPVEYPLDQEKITTLSSYVRNAPPIFRYFDKDGNEITDLPARLVDTKLIEVYLVVNVDPNRPPQDFELKSLVQLRNLKEE